MKSVFIAGSRRFCGDMGSLLKRLREKDIRAETSGEWDRNRKDTQESEREALLRAFQGIDNSDILYAYSKNGYVGRTVSMEMAYAYARGKEIISSHEVGDLSVRALVSKTMGPEELIERCRQA